MGLNLSLTNQHGVGKFRVGVHVIGLSRAADNTSRGKVAIKEFLGLFDEIATFRKEGLITDEAWIGMGRLITEMGASVDKAKGATETLAFMRNQLKSGNKIRHIEHRIEVLLPGGKTKGRIYDIVVEQADGTLLKYEVKAWKPESLESFLYLNFRGKKADVVSGEVQQLQTDLVSAINDSFSGDKLSDLLKIENRWLFDARLGETITKEQVIEKFIRNLKDDRATLEHLVKLTGNEQLFKRLFSSQIESVNKKAVREFMNELTDVLDHMIEINARVVM